LSPGTQEEATGEGNVLANRIKEGEFSGKPSKFKLVAPL